MAETLRELVVALSLDSSNFSRNMRTINQQIKEAESTFRLTGAGVENYEKTIAGTEAKLSMLGQKLTQQQRAVEQYSRALVAANDKLKENYDRHQEYTQRLEQAKARQEDLRFEVEAATVAYENYRDSLGETDSATIAAKQNLEAYQQEYEEATAEVTKLEGQVKALQKTMQNIADAVSKAQTDLNNAKAFKGIYAFGAGLDWFVLLLQHTSSIVRRCLRFLTRNQKRSEQRGIQNAVKFPC